MRSDQSSLVGCCAMLNCQSAGSNHSLLNIKQFLKTHTDVTFEVSVHNAHNLPTAASSYKN